MRRASGIASPAAGEVVPTRAADPLRVLLVNSMPDGALQRTERQFERLMQPASGDVPLRFSLTTLPEIPRGEWGRAHVAERYVPLDRTLARGTDLLVLTGTEPKLPRLEDEAYWGSLTRLLDWADANGVPTLLSCLAVHAAVQHFDGVRRVRLERKCAGLFEHEAVSSDPLLCDLPRQLIIPHSRWNDLPEAALVGAGYQIMTRSEAAGVDLFVRHGTSRWLLFQGHPEYEAENLWREYQRDVRRYLDREQDRYPDLPEGLAEPMERARLQQYRALAERDSAGTAVGDLPVPRIPTLPSPSPMNVVIRAWIRETCATLTNTSGPDATVSSAPVAAIAAATCA